VVPELYLFDLLQTPFWLTNRYDRGRLDGLRARLEVLAGAPVAEQALSRAIAVVNADRRLLQEAADLWRGPEPRLGGVDALAVIGAGWFMERGQHATLLRTLLDNAASLPRRAGPRLMIKGSPHDNADFYALVEQAGAVVVAGDHVWGDPTFAALVDEQADPMEALTAFYQLHSPSLRSYPQAAQDKKFMALIEAARVEGVVFYHDEHDDTLGWDYPDQKRLLDARGIPSVFLKRQSYRHPDRGAQLAAIRDFVATIAERKEVVR
jgi:benzoyl-CoA reductase/2-hydroxyglutaryl-CoA dehydratase subunit BcrC/BadD/HgdB